MPRMLITPKHWQDRADEAYHLAELARTPNLINLLIGIAIAYERQAKHAEDALADFNARQKPVLTAVK